MFIVADLVSLKKNFYSVLLLHLLKPLFSVFHGLQALSIFFFVLVNDLYIGEALQGVLGNRGKWYLFQGNRGTKAKF